MAGETALPMPFADWVRWVYAPAAQEPTAIGAYDIDVLRHAWHLDQNIYAADCLHCRPRHVDIDA